MIIKTLKMSARKRNY
ncbi:TPA: hypothetical protein ACGSYB_000903 [Shigella boydii]|nr:hypothetical protein [Shigella boydii]